MGKTKPADTAPLAADIEAAPEAEAAAPAAVVEEAAPAIAPAAAVEGQRITIEEACNRIMERDRKAYTGLYAFQIEEVREGRVRDTLEAYQARYAAFMARPIVG